MVEKLLVGVEFVVGKEVGWNPTDRKTVIAGALGSVKLGYAVSARLPQTHSCSSAYARERCSHDPVGLKHIQAIQMQCLSAEIGYMLFGISPSPNGEP